MTVNHDRVIKAARKAGGNAARRHKRGGRVDAPDPRAGSLLARKAATAWHAGFAEVHGAANGAESKAAAGYDGVGSGSGMISLDIPPGVVDPVPGGVDDHHVTVVYLGSDVSNDDFDQACERARRAAAAVPGPLTATLSGIDSFPPDERGMKPVFIPASIPGGDHLRNDLADLSASRHPGWSAHVTTHYAEPGDPMPEPQPHKVVTFTHLSVHRGDDVRRFPFGGQPQVKEMDMSVLTGMERKVGPHGYTHGWVYHGIPGTGDHVHHPSHGKGIVTAVTDKHVSVRFGSGTERTFEHSAPRPGKATGFVKRGEHDTAAAGHAGPHAGHAEAARKLAADVRAAGPQTRTREGHSLDPRQMAAQHLDAAAAHFDAGREKEGVSSLLSAKRDLGGEAYDAQREARGAKEELATAERHGSVTELRRAKVRNTARVSEVSSSHAERAEALHQAAKRQAGFSPGYLRGEGATDADVAELTRRFGIMHGRAPTAAEVAKIPRAKPAVKAPAPKTAPAPAAMTRDQGIAKARSIHEADNASGGGHLPPLALLGNDKHPDGSVTARAVDHEGRDYHVKLGADKTVTVTHKGKSLTEPAGANPTQKARELAGKLTAPAPAVAKPEADDFWAHEQPKAPPAPSAPKPKFDQGAMFAEPDKLGTAPMFGDKWGTGDITKPGAGVAAAPAPGRLLTDEEARQAYRAGTGHEPSQRILAGWASHGTDSDRDKPWHQAAVAAKSAGRPASAVPDFMQADQLERDSRSVRDPALEDRMIGAASHLRAGNHGQARELLSSARPADDFAASLVNEHLGKVGKPAVPDPAVARREARLAPAPSSPHAATARSLAVGVRLEPGMTRGQREEAETRLNTAARHLEAGNHAEAVRELDDTAHATGLRGGGVIKGSTAAKARALAAKIRAEHGLSGTKDAGVAREIKDLAAAVASISGREDAVRRHLADASTAIEDGDTKTAYGALDMARRHALGEFGDNPLRPVLLDDKTEAWRPIIRLRDSVRGTG